MEIENLYIGHNFAYVFWLLIPSIAIHSEYPNSQFNRNSLASVCVAIGFGSIFSLSQKSKCIIDYDGFLVVFVVPGWKWLEKNFYFFAFALKHTWA